MIDSMLRKSRDFNCIRVQLASPESILKWSHGEVAKPETINYRSFKPERDGLFCERIFGPVKDWECHCGKYKRIRYKGVICDRCGVEVTQSKVRRERLGHVKLAVPVSHIWYFKSLPSRMSYLLDISVRNLERILYYESYVVIDKGDAPINEKDLLSEDEVIDLEEQRCHFEVGIGAPAVKKVLQKIDIEELSASLRTQARMETSVQRKQDALKRLKVVEAFRQSNNRPEWMIMDAIPVIPPDLRPLVPLDGGRFATSDLNDLYKRVINRNNRLKKLIEIKAPEVILRNEKRMLQEAVDTLFDNGRRSKAVRGNGNRPLKSLSDLLKGKQGRFRQNLLGKRVDYSGRSVIVVGPEMKLHQCGLPKSMAVELFKPFIIKRLQEKGLVQTVKSAKKMVEQEKSEVWDILEEIIAEHCVLLNRAPTLHRLGIQAFQPVLVEGKAIKIHPLVCAAFNADFDGDQMAVHVPLSFESQTEAKVLMLSSNNLLKPSDGSPVVIDKPQDIALGCYYLTKVRPKDLGEGKVFSDKDEALAAHSHGKIALNSEIKVRIDGELLETTVGRIIFNEILPQGYQFVNELVNNSKVTEVTSQIYRKYGGQQTALFADRLKDLGFNYVTKSGVTIGIDDVVIPEVKDKLIDAALSEVKTIQDQYSRGIITDGERYNKTIDVWQHTTTDVSQAMVEALQEIDEGFNPVYMMWDSGARGSSEQINQLGGMRGPMTKPQRKVTGAVGEIIETPIIANFKEGLSVLEYFISTHGARKGLADTALKTAEAGYLTRKMVDVAQDIVVTAEGCNTILGIEIVELKEGEEVVEPLSDRIVGRTLLYDVYDPSTDELIASADELVDEEIAASISDAGIESVHIRSVLTCESRRGVCVKCYGRNLATARPVEIGDAVGVIAAQSIGEPGTQLTLRTFHIGGTASRIAEQSKIETKREGTIGFKDIECVEYLSQEEGEGLRVLSRKGEIEILDDYKRPRERHDIAYGALLKVKDGDSVKENQLLYEWDPYNNIILTDVKGKAMFADIVENVTFREELDETSGLKERVIIEQRDRSLSPRIEIIDENSNRIRNYIIPVGAHLFVHDEQEVSAGSLLVKIPRERSKTRDITGGLPRVAELFEARKPKNPAVVTEIDGIVKLGEMVGGSRELIVVGDDGEDRKYVIPYGKHLKVREEDRVTAGEGLNEGPINPHDILSIQGIYKVQEYLVNEIQAVYRIQGVKIDDKHVEVIVRQMLQKVRVIDPGDTEFLEGDEVDRFKFADENNKVGEEGGEPATFEPILFGITKASLRTDSFISAASFQETTRVLTEAAIQGKVDKLLGLKENVIIGHLIPAGTGSPHYRSAYYRAAEGEGIEIEALTEPDGEPAQEDETTVPEAEVLGDEGKDKQPELLTIND